MPIEILSLNLICAWSSFLRSTKIDVSFLKKGQVGRNESNHNVILMKSGSKYKTTHTYTYFAFSDDHDG